VNCQAVIFDLDGTLYDKSRLPFRLILSLLPSIRTLGSERKARKQLKGKDFDSEEAFYDALFGAMAAQTGKSVSAIRSWYFGRYMGAMVRALRKHYRLRPWVAPLMERLHEEGVPVVIYSDYGCVREKLEALGFDLSRADLLADAPSLGGLKPSEASARNLLGRIADTLGTAVDPARCLLVGDRDDTDGAAAKTLGIPYRHVEGDLCPITDV